MRQSTLDFLKRRDAENAAQIRANDPTNWENKRKAFLIDSRLNRMADAENERQLEMQRLKNTGQLDVADRTQTGATTRTNLKQAGLNKRFAGELGFKEAESGRKYALAGRRLGLDQQIADNNFWQKEADRKALMKRFGVTENRLDRRLGFEMDQGQNANNRANFLAMYGSEAGGLGDPSVAGIDEFGNPVIQDTARAQQYRRLQMMNDPEAQQALADQIQRRRSFVDPGEDMAREAEERAKQAEITAYRTTPEDQSAFQEVVANTSRNQVNARSAPTPLPAYNQGRNNEFADYYKYQAAQERARKVANRPRQIPPNLRNLNLPDLAR